MVFARSIIRRSWALCSLMRFIAIIKVPFLIITTILSVMRCYAVCWTDHRSGKGWGKCCQSLFSWLVLLTPYRIRLPHRKETTVDWEPIGSDLM